MASVAQKVEFRVYIEGHLIPCSGVSLTIYDGQRAQGYVLTTPSAAAKRIPPMSTVAIFYYDNNYGEWCLFWEGIFTGWQFNKSPMSRSISLQVSGWGVLQDKAFAYMMGSETQLLDSQTDIYGLGNSSPKLFDKKSASPEDVTKLTIANSALNYFQPRGAMDFTTMVEQLLKVGAGDFYDVTRRLTESLTWLNPLLFYRYCNSKMRYKTVAVKDDKFTSFFDFNFVQKCLTDFATTYFTGRATANDFIDAWMAQIYYSKSELVSPPMFASDSQDVMVQNIYAPKAFFNVPPACNTLFPEFVTSVSYAENFLAHPTRLLMKSNPAIFEETPVHMAHFYNDRTQYENSSDILAKMKSLQTNLFTSEYSAEEYEKYPTPAVDELNNSLYFTMIKGANADQKKLYASLGAATHYMYLERKYGVKPLTISGIFNPYFVVGFPCVLFDQEASFMAKPLSVTYNLSASGDASTTYICNFAVPLDREDIADAQGQKFPVLPGWLPTAYSPENIDATYKQLLGANVTDNESHSALGGAKVISSAIINVNKSGMVPTEAISKDCGVQPTKVNIAKVANSIFNLDRSYGKKLEGAYDVAPDKLDFARKYVLRGMTTYAKWLKFYGVSSSEKEPKDNAGDTTMKLYSHITEIKNTTGSSTFVNQEYQNNTANTTPEGLVNLENPNIKVEPYKYRLMVSIAKEMREVAQRG